jgi:iron(III) transport system ATP-binding protein
MVPQNYSLWPHMTVLQNIQYPLKARRMRLALGEKWAEQVATLVDCGNLLDRYPSQLSGGQQQRVALARGLVARPDLLLLDEPLSNLDTRLRDRVRGEIHELHERTGFTGVLVTHDQSEALALGSRIAVMRDGRIEQFDAPEVVYEWPSSEYVAAFLNMTNKFGLRFAEGAWLCGDQALSGTLPTIPPGVTEVSLRTRASDLTVYELLAPIPPELTTVVGTMVDSEYGGRHTDLTIDVGDSRIAARMSRAGAAWPVYTRGEAVRVGFRAEDARFYDSRGELMLAGSVPLSADASEPHRRPL